MRSHTDDEPEDAAVPEAMAPSSSLLFALGETQENGVAVIQSHGTEDDDAPPSSVHGEVDEDDWSRQQQQVIGSEDLSRIGGVDDEEELDETKQAANDDEQLMHLRDDRMQENNSSGQRILTPQQPELTMKEKLVLRERQRRIETERARLKRQFALSETLHEEGEEQRRGGGGSHGMEDNDLDNDSANRNNMDAENIGRNASREEDGTSHVQSSVGDEETLGEESTRAHPDEDESANNAQRTLGFNMERFLRNSETFNPELEPHAEDDREGATSGEQGVVMSRFLNERIVVAATDGPDTDGIDGLPSAVSSTAESTGRLIRDETFSGGLEGSTGRTVAPEPHRSVSFDIDNMAAGLANDFAPARERDALGASSTAMAGSTATFEEETEMGYVPPMNDPIVYSASLDMQADVTSSHGDALSHASDEPRVLRLTEADMLEMASIEEASIGNAPPSDRDDEEILSEIAELVDFGHASDRRPAVGDTTISQDTPTTAVESSSQLSGHQSQRSVHNIGTSVVSNSSADHLHDHYNQSDHHSVSGIEGIPSAPDPSRYLLSPGAASVAANPPSERGQDEDVDADEDDESPLREIDGMSLPNHGLDDDHAVQLIFDENIDRVPELPFGSGNVSDARNTNSDGILDHVNVPDLLNRPRHYMNAPHNNYSTDESFTSEDHNAVVEGFDFDKSAPRSPFFQLGRDLRFSDSLRALPDDTPSLPGNGIDVAPLRMTSSRDVARGTNNLSTATIQAPMGSSYGAKVDSATESRSQFDKKYTVESSVPDRVSYLDETAPLLSATTQQQEGGRKSMEDPETVANRDQKNGPFVRRSTIEDLLGVRHTENKEANRDLESVSKGDSSSDIAQRAFPAHSLALLTALAFQIPLLLVIVNGSDSICQQIGRKRYHLLLGFLPLNGAVSGNAALQGSALTKKAMSYSQINTPASYTYWLVREVGAAACLAAGSGGVVGALAYVVSGQDFAFSSTMFIAQIISIVAGGITGSAAPLLSWFLFRGKSAKWNGFLETTIKDIVGCISPLAICYCIFAMFGSDVDATDRCFA